MNHILATVISLLDLVIFGLLVLGGIIFARGMAICAEDGVDE
jgi:hypothetical protein